MARVRLLEAVRLLRARSSIKEGGLLWKLQASLAEAVADQEQLQGWVKAAVGRKGGSGHGSPHEVGALGLAPSAAAELQEFKHAPLPPPSTPALQ